MNPSVISPYEAGSTHGKDAIGRTMMLASLVFCALYYAFIWVQIIRGADITAGWPLWLTCVVVYAVIFAIFWLVMFFSDVFVPEYPDRLVEWTERIGIARFELYGLVLSVASVVICALTVPQMAPLSTIGGMGFLAMLAVRPRPAALEPSRSLYTPPNADPGLLSIPGAVTPGEKTIEATVVSKTFNWVVEWGEGRSVAQSLTVGILLSRLESFRQKNPYRETGEPRLPDFTDFVTHGITGELLETARYFQEQTEHLGGSPFHEICNVLAFAQSMVYKSDEESKNLQEYWRYPIEMLFDAEGDCEDHAILAACILRTLGHEVVMLRVKPLPQEDAGHVAIGVAATEGFPSGYSLVDGRYLYCETTHTGWRVGEIPPGELGHEIQVLSV